MHLWNTSDHDVLLRQIREFQDTVSFYQLYTKSSPEQHLFPPSLPLYQNQQRSSNIYLLSNVSPEIAWFHDGKDFP